MLNFVASPTDYALYQRLFVSIQDFGWAMKFASHLLKKGWHSAPWERRGSIYMQQMAYTSSLLTSYARPFTKSRGWPNLPINLVPYATHEWEFHKQLMDIRHQVFAHSDSSRHSVRPFRVGDLESDIVGSSFFRLSKEEVEMAISMMKTAIAGLQPKLKSLRASFGKET
jgi:hypothetical protein